MAATDTKPVGGKPDKLIRDALKAALRQEPDKLKRIVSKWLAKAEEGDMQAIKEMTDRIDGKAVQPVCGDDDDGSPPIKQHLTVTFVPPKVLP